MGLIELAENTLNDEEKTVYQAIKTYLSRNIFFKLDEIISYLKYNLDKSLNLNTLKIEKIIQSLMKKHLIASRSKLVLDDLLKNSIRKKIYEFIEKNPGVYRHQIEKTIGLGTYQTIWHLNMLKKFQLIRSQEIDNHEIYFKLNVDSKYDQLIYYFNNENVKKILTLLESKETGIQATEVSEILKMHYNTTRKYINILLELNLLKILKENDKKFYLINAQNYYDTLEHLRELKQIN